MNKIYIAAPLFSEADKLYNEKLASQIETLGFSVYLPQRNSSINDKSRSASAVEIFAADTKELDTSDIFIALLDGAVIDPGVASEIGYIAGINKTRETPIKMIGLLTDSRDMSRTSSETKNNSIISAGVGESQYCYQNLYTIGAIKKYGCVVSSINEVLEKLNTIKIISPLMKWC